MEEKVTSFLLTKKGDKQTFKNYRPVSLLPICWKILERLMFNEMFECLMKCSNFLLEINSFLLVSLVLNRAIVGSINYYQLLMRYIDILSITHEFF